MNVDNQTHFAGEAHGVLDENGRNLLLLLLKATYQFDQRGRVEIAEEQQNIELADLYHGEPGVSSIKYGSDFSFKKPVTDILLNGHAYAPASGTREMLVSLQVGNTKKIIKVLGNRYWFGTAGMMSISRPQTFDKLALIYENAFGGTDLSHPDPKKHGHEPRNPVGTGFRAKGSEIPAENLRLPNLEDPRRPIGSLSDRPAPACFAAVAPSWLPRLKYAGTYDDSWEKNRKPLLPGDFDFRFFNAAPPDLTAPRYLQGNEPVMIKGVTPEGQARFALPGVKPSCTVTYQYSEPEAVALQLDKLVINPDDRQFMLLWSGCAAVRGDFLDIEVVRFDQDR